MYSRPADLITFSNMPGDPTYRCAEARESYARRIHIIEQAAIETSADFYIYILKAVTTEGWSYEKLKVNDNIPCCKDTYYDLYRRFFWLLNKERD